MIFKVLLVVTFIILLFLLDIFRREKLERNKFCKKCNVKMDLIEEYNFITCGYDVIGYKCSKCNTKIKKGK